MKYQILLCILMGISIHHISQAQKLQSELSSELLHHYEDSDLPGFAVAIINQKGVLFEGSYGFADLKQAKAYSKSSLQNLGSLSKTICGLALVKAIELGKIDMESPINDFLPFPIINPHFPQEEIRVKHLATHTSTIRDTKHYGKSYILSTEPAKLEGMHTDYLDFIRSHENINLSDFLKKILHKDGKWYKKKNFLKAKVGTEASYANLNAALTAVLIESVSDMSFRAFTKKYIFEPLSMHSTAWSFEELPKAEQVSLYFPSKLIVPKYSLITYPDGGLISSIEDLSKFLTEMIKAFRGESTYLKTESARLLFPGDEDEYRAFWGMGEISRNIGHGGSDPGAQTDLQFNADRHIGRIILCNVNAEDNEKLWEQYQGIHKILAKYEEKLDRP
ncbi:MAG: serine hydrolase domain-containing protein [Bacteroidota bacterium]